MTSLISLQCRCKAIFGQYLLPCRREHCRHKLLRQTQVGAAGKRSDGIVGDNTEGIQNVKDPDLAGATGRNVGAVDDAGVGLVQGHLGQHGTHVFFVRYDVGQDLLSEPRPMLAITAGALQKVQAVLAGWHLFCGQHNGDSRLG